MCLLCAAASSDLNAARRIHVLRLLALVEHPDALPTEAALRLAHELLVLTQPDAITCRCDAVAPPEASDEADLEGRPS